ncbi:MAG: AAA family ATPase [Richelia sp. RM2_1_2]|nr:AAA family ATPase [Richelia sp. RM2_1_2]
MQGSGYYFLSRPRRFGKSLLISTLSYLFEGKKELFNGLWIEDKIEWKQHPIIHLSFAVMDYKNFELDKEIVKSLKENAQKYAIDLEGLAPKEAFRKLIIELSNIEKVVILIDEYDKPIIDYLEPDKIPTALQHRDILKNFYGILKDADKYIRFLFITGFPNSVEFLFFRT